MNNLVAFNPMIIKSNPELKTEIIKTFSLFNLTDEDTLFLRAHSDYKDDSLSDEVGITYQFNIKDRLGFNFNYIERYESYLEGIKANPKLIDCMKIARDEGATIVEFWVVADKSMLGLPV